MSDRDPNMEWTPAEEAALEALRADEPPADLESAVVGALAARGLVVGGPDRRVPARRAWAWAALALAACLAAFFAGVAISDRGAAISGIAEREGAAQREPSPSALDQRFVLLLYEDAAYRAPTTPEEQEARVAEYVAWADSLGSGIVVGGEELAQGTESDRLDGRSGPVESGVGAPETTYGTLAGYFLIEAPDQAAAVAIARTMPHLAYGGTVVVRRIVEH